MNNASEAEGIKVLRGFVPRDGGATCACDTAAPATASVCRCYVAACDPPSY